MKSVIYYGCRGETAKLRLGHFFSVRSVLRESLRYTGKKGKKRWCHFSCEKPFPSAERRIYDWRVFAKERITLPTKRLLP